MRQGFILILCFVLIGCHDRSRSLETVLQMACERLDPPDASGRIMSGDEVKAELERTTSIRFAPGDRLDFVLKTKGQYAHTRTVVATFTKSDGKSKSIYFELDVRQ
jgi:hypothetical protein